MNSHKRPLNRRSRSWGTGRSDALRRSTGARCTSPSPGNGAPGTRYRQEIAQWTSREPDSTWSSSKIRPWEVLDAGVLGLFQRCPRDAYVPEEYRPLAYADTRIPLGNGQEMMLPREEARLLQALQLGRGDAVLEVGTGSGYLTALLAALVASRHEHRDPRGSQRAGEPGPRHRGVSTTPPSPWETGIAGGRRAVRPTMRSR